MLPNIGMPEMIVIMGIAILLFGNRLPEVGRMLGKGITEFRKGMSEITDDFHAAASGASTTSTSTRGSFDDGPRGVEYAEATVPRFEPPAAPPRAVEPEPHHAD
ncbi:MAG: twin-arginine translocase TatA/TatE family subunit [Planctomycetota bacterium]|nr:twin-arginine translocase TatA/TatE family subunit [Planctomycetota bacterium]